MRTLLNSSIMRFDSPQAAEATDYHLARVPETSDLGVLSKAAMHCQACPLYRNATQTVFGEGRLTAKIIFIGEQPGDQEDLAGKPFVGPAGRVLDQALEEVGIDRASCYVTNAVKHFKWKERGNAACTTNRMPEKSRHADHG